MNGIAKNIYQKSLFWIYIRQLFSFSVDLERNRNVNANIRYRVIAILKHCSRLMTRKNIVLRLFVPFTFTRIWTSISISFTGWRMCLIILYIPVLLLMNKTILKSCSKSGIEGAFIIQVYFVVTLYSTNRKILFRFSRSCFKFMS